MSAMVYSARNMTCRACSAYLLATKEHCVGRRNNFERDRSPRKDKSQHDGLLTTKPVRKLTGS